MEARDRGADRRRRRQGEFAAGIGLALVGLILFGAGCSEQQRLVCVGKPAHVAVVASTSETDYGVSTELAREAGDKAMRSTVRSCGELMVGIQDGRPDSNLALTPKRFEAPAEKEYDPAAARRPMFEAGEEFVESELLEPLAKKKPVGGSPFFSSVADIQREADARGWLPVTIVLVGDGFVVERSPQTHKMVRFGQETISKETMAEFTELLGDLHGTCVLVVGFGADSHLPGWRIRETELLLKETFEGAGATFTASRSANIEPGCSRRS